MARLTWGPSAIRDLDGIAAFIATDSPHYAKLLVQRIVSRVETLAQFPRAGRVVPEYARNDLREFIIDNYRVVYRIRIGDIQVVTVVHGARPLPSEPVR